MKPRVNHAALARSITAEDIEAKLTQMSRDPFRVALAEALAAGPGFEDLKSLAQKAPDRWGQLIAMLGRLAGYTERLDVAATVKNLDALSDAELITRLAELQGEAGERHE